MSNCPFCGSSETSKTFNFNESVCNGCGCDFRKNSDGTTRVFKDGSYATLCESIAKKISESISDPSIINLTQRLCKDNAGRGIAESYELYESLLELSNTLLTESKSGLRGTHDFQVVLESAEMIETLAKTLVESRQDILEDNNMAPSSVPYDIDNDYEDEVDIIGDDEPFNTNEYPELNEENKVPMTNEIDNVRKELQDIRKEINRIAQTGDTTAAQYEVDNAENAINALWDEYVSREGSSDTEEVFDDTSSDELFGDEDESFEDDLEDTVGDDEFDDEDEDTDDDQELGAGEGQAVGLDSIEDEDEESLFESHLRKIKEITSQIITESDTVGGYKGANVDSEKLGTTVTDEPENLEPLGSNDSDVPYTSDVEETDNQFGDEKTIENQSAIHGTPKGDDFVLKGKPDGKGLGVKKEGFNGYRIGDKILVNESRVEWKICEINGHEAIVEHKNTKMTVDLVKEDVSHADVSIRQMTERDTLAESKAIWETMQNEFDNECVGGVCGLSDTANGTGMDCGVDGNCDMTSPIDVQEPSVVNTNLPPQGMSSIVSGLPNVPSVSPTNPNDIYAHVKDTGLADKPLDVAMDDLATRFNNQLEELQNILDDAKLSQTEPNVNENYHYSESSDREIDVMQSLQEKFERINKVDTVKNNVLIERARAKLPKITSPKDQNNDRDIEILGRSWINQMENGI